jgi:hypothetical protein
VHAASQLHTMKARARSPRIIRCPS